MTGPLHITDLAEPQFTAEVHEMLEVMATMGAGCALDAAALHEQAVAETGLDDFGDRDYEARLDVLLGALRDVPGLTAVGILSFHSQVLQLLKNRLLLADLLTREPQILEIELAPPIVIAGLPRTGTTHLHQLLATDTRLRTLPYWESLEPFPLAAEVGIEPDPRRTRTETSVWFMNQAMPLFPLMHEMTTDHIHEEIQLLAIDFSTMFFESIASIPAWEAYYRAHDQTAALPRSSVWSSRPSNTCGAAPGGSSSHPSTSSSCRPSPRCSRTRPSWSPTATPSPSSCRWRR